DMLGLQCFVSMQACIYNLPNLNLSVLLTSFYRSKCLEGYNLFLFLHGKVPLIYGLNCGEFAIFHNEMKGKFSTLFKCVSEFSISINFKNQFYTFQTSSLLLKKSKIILIIRHIYNIYKFKERKFVFLCSHKDEELNLKTYLRKRKE
ncbi:hypothetical protein L9F63_023704, partial [Diploptera punctata]